MSRCNLFRQHQGFELTLAGLKFFLASMSYIYGDLALSRRTMQRPVESGLVSGSLGFDCFPFQLFFLIFLQPVSCSDKLHVNSWENSRSRWMQI